MGGAGAGIRNTGAIGSLANSGTIEGGAGGSAGDAIYSAGKHASIGPIINTGQIIGNVEIDNQASVTVKGGSGKTFGSWTGGTITIGTGNLTFAGGNTALGDSVVVDGGSGIVFNDDPLRVTTSITITGNFNQNSTGELDFLFSGDMAGQYGTLRVTGTTLLDGGFGVDLAQGFHLAAGETFDLVDSVGALSGGFDSLSFNGGPCSTRSTDVWLCPGAGLFLDLSIITGPNGSVDLTTAAIPEPSTWALLAAGFLGLAMLGLGAHRERHSKPEQERA
jgi:hypothetical protein